MTPEAIESAAHALFAAEQNRSQIGLLSGAHPGMTIDDAYAVQAALVQCKLTSGRTIRGWKIGLTSKAMQYALHIDTPDSGVLFDDMFFASGDTIPAGRFIQPRIEAEIAFIMKADLRVANMTRDDVLAATDYVSPVLEILDTRIVRQDPENGTLRTVTDTIADNAANAGLVLGTERHDPGSLDLRWVGVIVSRNDEVEETGLGAGVLNDPVTSVIWLANRLAAYGNLIRAGDVVLSGSFIRPIEASSGASTNADFGSFGKVLCHFQ